MTSPNRDGSVFAGRVGYKGKEYPAIHFGALLGMPESGPGSSGADKGSLTKNLLLLNPAVYPFALMADRLLDTQEIVIRPIQLALPEAKYFSGITFLPDGSLAFIIDPVSLLAEIQARKGEEDTGSEFIISLESSDAAGEYADFHVPIIPAVIGNDAVGIPSQWIVKRYRIPRPQRRSQSGRKKLVLGSKKIMLLDLGRLMNIPANPDPIEVVVLLCKINNRYVAIEVDDVLSSVSGYLTPVKTGDTPVLFAVLENGDRLRIPESDLIMSAMASDEELSRKGEGGDSNIQAEEDVKTGNMDENEHLLVCFEVAGRRLGIQFEDVQEILPAVDTLRFDCDGMNPRGFVNLRGECIEIFDLGKWLGDAGIDTRKERALIVSLMGENKRGLIVDSVITEVSFLDKQHPFALPHELDGLFPLIYTL